jgi:4-hydroxy-tetrahydrodipicolinate reductase
MNMKADAGMSDNPMKLVVVGAGGRMGQSLIRAIHETKGAVLHAATGREGSPFIGKNADELAGVGYFRLACESH